MMLPSGKELPHRWERTYCRYFNGRITKEQFADALGLTMYQLQDILTEYRRMILTGVIPDPRDKYGWR